MSRDRCKIEFEKLAKIGGWDLSHDGENYVCDNTHNLWIGFSEGWGRGSRYAERKKRRERYNYRSVSRGELVTMVVVEGRNVGTGLMVRNALEILEDKGIHFYRGSYGRGEGDASELC